MPPAAIAIAALILNASQPQAAEASRLEAQVLAEMNFARSHPDKYLSALSRYRNSFRGNVSYEPNDPSGVETEEGVSAVDEAIRFVRGVGPESSLEWDAELAAVAAQHADDQDATGIIGHNASNGSSFERRVQRLRSRALVAEIISYGESSQTGVVRQLIVDDGVGDRGHRIDLFDPTITRAGVACRPHPTYGVSCVIDLSAE